MSYCVLTGGSVMHTCNVNNTYNCLRDHLHKILLCHLIKFSKIFHFRVTSFSNVRLSEIYNYIYNWKRPILVHYCIGEILFTLYQISVHLKTRFNIYHWEIVKDCTYSLNIARQGVQKAVCCKLLYTPWKKRQNS